MTTMRRTWLLVLILALAGCGFHLRGEVKLPANISTVRIEAPNRLLQDELSIYLKAGGAHVTTRAEPADATLALSGEDFQRRVLSVDPNTGKAREYELAYTVSVSMTRADGSVLLAPQQVRLVRDYVYDQDAVLGKSREEDVLRDEMRRDAVQQVLRRMAATQGG